MKRGGKRPGAGRPNGAQNKSNQAQTATLSEMAREYAPEALAMLAEVMRYGVSDTARVAAANAILDRGFGRPKPIEIEPEKDSLALVIEQIQARGSKAPIAKRGVVRKSDAPVRVSPPDLREPHTGNQLCLKISEE